MYTQLFVTGFDNAVWQHGAIWQPYHVRVLGQKPKRTISHIETEIHKAPAVRVADHTMPRILLRVQVQWSGQEHSSLDQLDIINKLAWYQSGHSLEFDYSRTKRIHPGRIRPPWTKQICVRRMTKRAEGGRIYGQPLSTHTWCQRFHVISSAVHFDEMLLDDSRDGGRLPSMYGMSRYSRSGTCNRNVHRVTVVVVVPTKKPKLPQTAYLCLSPLILSCITQMGEMVYKSRGRRGGGRRRGGFVRSTSILTAA